MSVCLSACRGVGECEGEWSWRHRQHSKKGSLIRHTLLILTAICGCIQWKYNHASVGRAASYITDKREGCLNVHLPNEKMWHANVLRLGYFIVVSLAWYFSDTYAHLQKYFMLSCSVWFSASSIWIVNIWNRTILCEYAVYHTY